MTLLAAVVRRLRECDIPFAAIGATALMQYGVSRATRDVDLLCVELQVLDEATWEPLALQGAAIDAHRNELCRSVQTELAVLPEDSRALWARIRARLA